MTDRIDMKRLKREFIYCKLCKGWFTKQGFHTHKKKCMEKNKK